MTEQENLTADMANGNIKNYKKAFLSRPDVQNEIQRILKCVDEESKKGNSLVEMPIRYQTEDVFSIVGLGSMIGSLLVMILGPSENNKAFVSMGLFPLLIAAAVWGIPSLITYLKNRKIKFTIDEYKIIAKHIEGLGYYTYLGDVGERYLRISWYR